MKIAVDKDKINLLNKLMRLDYLQDYYLAGGTNLAYKYEHRISIDLDLFALKLFDIQFSNYINIQLKKTFGNSFESTGVSEVGIFGYIDAVKTDFINYPYELIKPIEIINNVRLASSIDIAAMKINAIIGRGTQKDFFDIHLLLQKHNLQDILNAYKLKYKVDNNNLALKSLIYFKDAENKKQLNNNVESLLKTPWNMVKKDIIKVVKQF